MEIQLSKVKCLIELNKCLCLPHELKEHVKNFLLSFLQVRFQHDVYPQSQVSFGPAADQPVSRQVFVVQDLEIRDRLAASQMNKFLYLYSSKEMPRKAHSNMVRKAIHSHYISQACSCCNLMCVFGPS